MKCSICGKETNTFMYANNICSNDCFSKYFWTKVLDDKAIIIDGYCYHIGKESNGKKYTILFNDGIKMTTSNLWSNGKIPEKFMKPDNAKFI